MVYKRQRCENPGSRQASNENSIYLFVIPSLSPHELKTWREANNLSQDELGSALGFSREWIGMLERGEREISAKFLMRFEQRKRELELSKREHLNLGAWPGRALADDPAKYEVVAIRQNKNEPIDPELAALLRRFDEALQRGELTSAAARDAASVTREVFLRYMDAGDDRDRIGWLNIELRRVIADAPFPRKHT